MRQYQRLIGVSLGVQTTDEALAALEQVAAQADIAELRLDFMADYDLPRLLADRPCPVIVTNRPRREGGRFAGSDEERVRPLLQAIDLGAEFVDIEHDSISLMPAERGNTQLVVSFHDFQATPPTLPRIAADLQEQGADVVKVVGMAQGAADNRRVFDVFRQATVPTIAICMGEAGLPSRVLALRSDRCLLTYATLGTGEQVAPGQLLVAAMREVYAAASIGPQTSAIGLVSATLPADTAIGQMNRTLREHQRDAVVVPFILPQDADSAALLPAYADRAYGLAAWLILPPHQEALARPGALDRLDSSVSAGGAVNLVIPGEDGLVGLWMPQPLSVLLG